MEPGVVLGLVPHTGWTWLVRVRGSPVAAAVEIRARVVACSVAEGRPPCREARSGDDSGGPAGRRVQQKCVLEERTHRDEFRLMSVHPVPSEKRSSALVPETPPAQTRRDARLPRVTVKVHAVIGMRRAGKSTFLRQLLAERRQVLPPERAIYLSFDDDRLADFDLPELGFLLEEFYRRHPALRERETVHWFLDEIQLVPGWERFVRRVLDAEKVEIVVSGSSARMLSREVHTLLRGRGLPTVVRPFSFREFLRHRGEEPAKEPRRRTAAERSLVEKRFREFLVEGGLPEAQGLPAALRIEVLQGYVNTVLFRDVVERYEVSQVAALRWLVRHCLRNPTGSLSVHRLHQNLKAQGHGVAKDAVHALFGRIRREPGRGRGTPTTRRLH